METARRIPSAYGSCCKTSVSLSSLSRTALFHLANAPVMPLVALYVKHLDGD